MLLRISIGMVGIGMLSCVINMFVNMVYGLSDDGIVMGKCYMVVFLEDMWVV